MTREFKLVLCENLPSDKMNDFLETFIESGKGADFRKIDELQLDVIYKVVEFTLKKTQFGVALEAQIVDPETSKNFYCFFPERLAKKIKSDDELEYLNQQQLSVKFKGRVNKVAVLEFSTPN